jgi:hypothetical protein
MPVAEGPSMLRGAAAAMLAAAVLLGGCVPEGADDGSLPDTDVLPDIVAADGFAEAVDGSADALDVGPETATDDVALPDLGSDAEVDAGTDSGLPGPDASCAELSGWILEYSRLHGACSAQEECVAATDIFSVCCCQDCYLINADLVAGGMYSPALRADAVTAEFTSVRDRFWAECAMGIAHHDWHWVCFYDGVIGGVEILCVSRRCVANPIPGRCTSPADAGTG